MFSKMFRVFNKPDVSKGLMLKTDPFTFSSDVVYRKKDYFKYSDLKDELLDYKDSKSTIYCVYHMVCKNNDTLFFESLNIKPSVFVIKSGFLGREFNKTANLCVSYRGECSGGVFEVISGQGYFLLYEDGSLDVKLINVLKGSYVVVPKGFKFVIINSSPDKNLVCMSLIGKNSKFVSNERTKVNGGAPLFLTKNGFVRNSNLGPVYHLQEFEGDYLGENIDGGESNSMYSYSFDKKKGLYGEVIYLPEKFKFLFN